MNKMNPFPASSKREAELKQELEAMREAGAEEKRAWVELDWAETQRLIGATQEKWTSWNACVFWVADCPDAVNIVVVSSGSSIIGVKSSDVAVRYQQLVAYGEQIAQESELARVSKENMTLRAALRVLLVRHKADSNRYT